MKYMLEKFKSKFHIIAFALIALLCLTSISANRECTTFCVPVFAAPPQRDHLTLLESDRVREAREIERRMDVFIKVIERRLLALTDPQAAQSRQVQRDIEQWGELQTGTRLELLTDMARTLEEAITNIEDASTRPGAVPEHSQRALRKLSEASARFIAQLSPMRASLAEDSPDREQLERTIEYAQEVVAAANTQNTNRTNGN
jgi:hypothetical protein